MLDRNKMPKLNKRQEGFSLVELMISIAIGLVITAAVTAMAVNSLKMNSQTLKSARLNQDMGAVMQIMVNEIRRAGYGSKDYQDALETLSVPGDIELVDLDVSSIGAECILYRYDANDNNLITEEDDRKEKRGFRITGTSIEMATIDADASDCSSGDWVSLTDPDVISITSLTFTTANSKCTSTDAEMSIRIKPDVADTEFACSKATVDNVQKWAIDGDGNWRWVDLLSDAGLPLNGGSSVGIRHVNIALEAELTRDSSVTKNLDVSIKVRNDHSYLD